MSRRKTGQNTYPRPRPATYDAGAGMERNASLFLSDDMAQWLEMEILCVQRVSSDTPQTAKEGYHVPPYISGPCLLKPASAVTTCSSRWKTTSSLSTISTPTLRMPRVPRR